MEPLDAMETPDPDGEGQQMLLKPAKNYDTFHRYPDLPFELRAQIRAFAIEGAFQYREERYHGGSQPCSRLAFVSREWQDDVEKALFSKIRVYPLDRVGVYPLNEDQILDFEQHFTDKRKTYLTQLEVAVNDDTTNGLWVGDLGLLNICRFMEKTGQLFQQLNGWNFSGDGNKQRSISVMFATTSWYTETHPGKFDEPELVTPSLWDPNKLRKLTWYSIPANVVLWAIKSEFPSCLNMVTHLTFTPDCLPIAAAKRIVQIMPNLESCTFETRFSCKVEKGWSEFTDFIHHLWASAPSLRKLRLMRGEDCSISDEEVSASLIVFANTLRDLSQSLECLWVWPFEVHEAFLLPFSENADADTAASGSHCTWPKLQHLVLGDLCPLSSWGPLDIHIAAAKAALRMPSLKSMEITTAVDSSRKYAEFQREPREMHLLGFREDEEPAILAAYAPLVGGQAKLVDDGLDSDEVPPTRTFKASTEGTTGS